MNAGLTGFFGASVAYVGDRFEAFAGELPSGAPAFERPRMPAYAQTDGHIGVRRDSWTVEAFVRNATDERGFLSRNALDGSYTVTQPRTVGLSVSRKL